MSQQHFVGLDVSVKKTAICVVDLQGRVVDRAAVESPPAVISQYLLGLRLTFSRVGLEAGPLSPWLYAGLVEAALPVICVETRHMHAALSARINKTDRNDALGIAQMMRVGLFKPVHVKTLASQQRRLLLTSRKLLQRKVYDIENDLRGQLRNFGLKVGIVGAVGFEQRVRDLVLDLPAIAAVIIPLLAARNPNRAYRVGNALPLRHQHIHLAQLRNNLLGLVSLPRHRGPPWPESHTSGRTTSKGEAQHQPAHRSNELVP